MQKLDSMNSTTPAPFKVGDTVLIKQPRKHNLSTPLKIILRNRTMITVAQRDFRVTRNASLFKAYDLAAPPAISRRNFSDDDIYLGLNPGPMEQQALTSQQSLTSPQQCGTPTIYPLPLHT